MDPEKAEISKAKEGSLTQGTRENQSRGSLVPSRTESHGRMGRERDKRYAVVDKVARTSHPRRVRLLRHIGEPGSEGMRAECPEGHARRGCGSQRA